MARRPAAPSAAPDRAAMERAIADFLRAARIPTGDPELEQTPARVAAAWADEFVDGYRVSVKDALGGLSAAPKNGGLVLVTHVEFTGVCPHHLLPYPGVAHVAYRPGRFVAGFGRLAVLVDALAHRLLLQETLARELADALVSGLSAKGAAVVLQAAQPCMTLRGERRTHSKTVVEATSGKFPAADLSRLWLAAKPTRVSK